jgi:hypothetical protein
MNVKHVCDAGKTGRDDVRLPIDNEPDVANKCLVKNGVNSFAVKSTALWQALQASAPGLRDLVVHRVGFSASVPIYSKSL